MENLYIILSGSIIEGSVYGEDIAEKYCAVKNKELGYTKDSKYHYIYKELKLLEVSDSIKDAKVYYDYYLTYSINRDNNEFKLDGMYLIDTYIGDKKEDSASQSVFNKWYIYVRVNLEEKNVKMAKVKGEILVKDYLDKDNK